MGNIKTIRLWEYVHEEAVDVYSPVLDMTIFGQSYVTICIQHHNYVQEKKNNKSKAYKTFHATTTPIHLFHRLHNIN